VVNFGFLENVQPVTGQGLELDVIAAVIIGGTRLGGGEGSIIGTLLGVLLIGVVRNGLVLLGVTPLLADHADRRGGDHGSAGRRADDQEVDLAINLGRKHHA